MGSAVPASECQLRTVTPISRGPPSSACPALHHQALGGYVGVRRAIRNGGGGAAGEQRRAGMPPALHKTSDHSRQAQGMAREGGHF